jgi:hypothetical protein
MHTGLWGRQNGTTTYIDTTYATPVRPGEPGRIPFWNQFARRFIFPPAFNFVDSTASSSYRFIVTAVADSQSHSFIAATSYHPLTPIWKELAAGEYLLRIESIPLGACVGERRFMKSPHFRGIIDAPAYSYTESARRCFADVFDQEKVQAWLTEGKPYPYYPKWIYPAKMMGSLAAGMAHYSHLLAAGKRKTDVLTVARRAANFLLSLSEPAGRPWEYCPPTFWDGVNRDIHPIFMGELLTSEPAETGMCYLDLYEASGDSTYLKAAINIAKTFAKNQLPQGTWHQRIELATGKPLESSLMVPAAVIGFFDRLIESYGLEIVRSARQRAFNWCMDHPMKTFNWEAQFEDTRPRNQYKNQSHREANLFAALLFRECKTHPEYLDLAIEVLRWAEDSFVIWEKSDPVLAFLWFKPNTRWNGNDPYFGTDWFVPCAVEQYAFYTPINGATAGFIDVFLEAFKATRNPVYLAKAVALANTLTLAQRYWGGGEIPTHLRKVMPELNWMNASLHTAISLQRNNKLLNTFAAK